MVKRLTYTYVKKAFEFDGYTLISNNYKNAKTKLLYKCPEGHEHSITWSDWSSGHRCPHCYGNASLTEQEITAIFLKYGYDVLDIDYSLGRKTIHYKCPSKHKHRVRLDHFINGVRCPYCSNNIKKDIFSLKEIIESEGYTLISDNFSGVFKYLCIKCPDGHEYVVSYHNWSQGRRCPYCNGGISFTEDEVEIALGGEGYKLLSPYINSSEPIKVLCPNKHKYVVRYNNWRHKNSRCKECSGNGSSSAEVSIRNYLKSVNIIYIANDRELITPYELDLLLPEYNIAIEYCGLYWHSDLCGKGKRYHLDKLNACLKNNIRLITIFEDEWLYKQNIVLSVLNKILNTNKIKILRASECTVDEISTKEACVFCEKSHLQGHGDMNGVKLGAFYNNDLVAVMTFSKLQPVDGIKENKDGKWELHRFCNKLNYSIIGGASKLMKYFQHNFYWNSIFSFVDRRWSDGKLYSKLGFDFSYYTEPNYWYILNKRRIHRFNFIKNKQADPCLTALENRQTHDHNIIWDCGNIKYTYNKEYI